MTEDEETCHLNVEHCIGDVAKYLTAEPRQTRGGDGEHESSIAAGGV
jgi:hypothetical protein